MIHLHAPERVANRSSKLTESAFRELDHLLSSVHMIASKVEQVPPKPNPTAFRN